MVHLIVFYYITLNLNETTQYRALMCPDFGVLALSDYGSSTQV